MSGPLCTIGYRPDSQSSTPRRYPLARRILAGAALTGAVLAGCTIIDRVSGPGDDRRPVTRCEEDMPCWDCSTMGNRVCGPVSVEVGR